ncbi:MAG: phosphoenolpyruvate--protein phosphotransferase [Deltaproteobacteria bacterium]|jgi:phosphotransferase system enzyme I (PtsI)|nr:phosphoenolpyruvate--protein phosphotransferase [Deltaproteobacteria bacterium]
MKRIAVRKTTSKGIVAGRVFLHKPMALKADTALVGKDSVGGEKDSFLDAVSHAKAQLSELAKVSDIFMAHLDVADDPALRESVMGKIENELKNAELAVEESAKEIAALFEETGDGFLAERAQDVLDVCSRIMRCLKGVGGSGFGPIHEPVVLVARDLRPSDTAAMDKDKVLGLITANGGETSHVAIMAKGLGIPAIVGVEGIDNEVRDGGGIILDAVEGTIILDPDEKTLEEYGEKRRAFESRRETLSRLKGLPATTTDGHTVGLAVNVGSIRDAQEMVAHGIRGIGLLRSEFLYMEGSSFPPEGDQFAAYKACTEIATDGVIVRTLDIGGDKGLPYFRPPKEENPYLGFRGIRLSLGNPGLFRTQLRAILRASAFGKIRILYPMVSQVDELRQANSLLAECMAELTAEKAPFDPDIKKGVMIETPAAVMLADDLARECDFFSIGSNDLTQYVLAVDRGNLKVAPLYDPFSPAVIRSIARTVEAGHANGIHVHLCGDLAGNDAAIPILIGLGLDGLSMPGSLIPEARYVIRNTSMSEARALALKASSLQCASEVRELILGQGTDAQGAPGNATGKGGPACP